MFPGSFRKDPGTKTIGVWDVEQAYLQQSVFSHPSWLGLCSLLLRGAPCVWNQEQPAGQHE